MARVIIDNVKKVYPGNVTAVQEFSAEITDGEFVQLYVRDVDCSVPQPMRQLKAFQRVHLKEGRKATVRLKVAVRELCFWDETGNSLLVEPGDFDVMVGASAEDIRARGRITVEDSARIAD